MEKLTEELRQKVGKMSDERLRQERLVAPIHVKLGRVDGTWVRLAV